MESNTDAMLARRRELRRVGAASIAFFIPLIVAAAYLNMGQTCSCGSTCPPAAPDFRVSKSTGGVAADDASTDGAVAAQGNDIAFSSAADNLDPAAASVLGPHVFVHNISTRTTNWVSLAALGEPNAIGSGSPALSEYGQFIAFEQQFFSIPPTHAIIFRDLDAATPDFETIASTGTTPASDPTMSGDGRFVAFATEAALLPEDTDAASDIYLKDLLSDTLILRSDDAGAVDAVRPRLSRDGQWITYDLESGLSFPGLIVVDVERIQGLVGLTGDLPSLSDDGSMVAFRQKVGGVYRIFVEPPLGIDPSQEVSVDASGIPATDDCDNPVISGNGRYVAFSCIEAMTDHGALNQVYVRDLIEQTTKLASITDTGVPANSTDSKPVGMSANGNAVTIESSADNLGDVPGGFPQLFRIPISYWDEGSSTCSADDTTCDGNDDDCDGQTDEDYVSQATSCGIGLCISTGTTTCNNGVPGDNCTPLPGAPDTNCDGIDDDCDGTPDDNYPPQLVTCGVGACQGTDMTSCVGAQVVHSCTPSPEHAAPSDNTCDGIDNNCDGQTDEGHQAPLSTCFFAGCARNGALACNAGVVVDTCPTAACVEEADCADVIDNDGDGAADCADVDCLTFAGCSLPPALAPVSGASVPVGEVHPVQLQGTDPEGATLSYAVYATTASNISLDSQTGEFAFSPDINQVGAHLFTFSVSDGTHVTTQQATLTVPAPNPNDDAGVMGYVYDAVFAEGGELKAIENVEVTDLESGLSATTDVTGSFVLTGLGPGLHHIEFDGANGSVPGESYTYLGYRAPKTIYAGVVDFLERPVYLPRLDPAGMGDIEDPNVPGAQDTLLTNPTIGVELLIPLGTVKDDNGDDYVGPISVSEVPEAFTPGALPDTMEPAMVVTIQPMGLTFDDPVPITFPNVDELPDGSEVDLWSLDHATGTFFIAGTGIVVGTEIQTLTGGVREASWHFPLPPSDEESDDGHGDGPGEEGTDTDDDGVDDSEECEGEDCPDTDDDGSPDYADPDDDGDGTDTADEDTDGDGDPTNDDIDGDGDPNYLDSDDSGPGGGPSDGGDPPITPPGGGGGGGGGGPCADTDDFSSRLTRKTGCLQSLVSLPTYRSLDVERGVQLAYVSERAFPHPLVAFGSTILRRAAVPEDLSYELSVGGVNVAQPVFLNPDVFFENFDNPFRGVAGFDARGFATGTYSATLRVTSHYRRSRVASKRQQKVAVINGASSSIGAGWSVVGIDRLHIQGDGEVLLEGGSGYFLHYEPGNTSQSTVIVDGRRNIFRAIQPVDDSDCAPGTGCDGLDPQTVDLPATNDVAVQVTSAEGTTKGGNNCSFVGPDGGFTCHPSWTPNIGSANNISGFRDDTQPMKVLGVFLGTDPDLAPLPQRLDLSFSENETDFYPQLNQTFVVGDGRNAVGQVQTFHAPAGALKVAFGFANSAGSADPETISPPGWMFDNDGQIDLEVVTAAQTLGAVTFRGPRYDRTTLVRNADASYTRTSPDGTVASFDVSGLMTSVADRFGNTFVYSYDPEGRLKRITDPVASLWTEFTYVGEHLRTITDPYGRDTTLAHDSMGDLRSMQFPDASSQEFEYDGRHLMTAERDRLNYWTTRTYHPITGRVVDTTLPGAVFRQATAADSEGFVDPGSGTVGDPAVVTRPEDARTTVIDAEDRTSVHRLNRFGKTLRTERGGLVQEFKYDRLQRPIVQKHANGTKIIELHDWNTNTVTRTHVQLGEALEAVLGPGQATIVTQSDDLDRVTAVSTAVGTSTTDYFDADSDGDEDGITLTSAAGRQTFMDLNDKGQLCAETDRFGAHWRFEYDARGNPSKTVQGTALQSCTPLVPPAQDPNDARTTDLTFDPLGLSFARKEAASAPEEQLITEFYDAHGRLEQLEEPEHEADGGVRFTDFGYDDEGRNRSIVPPTSSEHMFDYTPRGDILSYTPPALSEVPNVATTYEHNEEHQRKARFEPDGLYAKRFYDSQRGDLEHIETVRGNYVYGYDPQGPANPTGQLASIATPQGDVLSYTYSPTYQGTLMTGYSWTGQVAGQVDWTFTRNQLVGTEKVKNAFEVSFGYDPDNLVTSAGALTLLRPENHGRVTGTTLGQVTTAHDYSKFGELSRESAERPGNDVFYEVSYAGYEVASDPQLGQRDKLGRIIRRVETLESEPSVVYEYSYTPGGALKEVLEDGFPVEQYAYDQNGNRTSDLTTSGIDYDEQDRIRQYGSTTYAYTARGALERKVETGGTTTYDYDVFGNLRKVTLPDNRVIEYVIDGLNRRIGKKVDGVLVQGLLWRDGLRVAAELGGQGNVVSRFIYGERANVPEYMEHDSDGNGTMDATYRFVHDHLGSVRMVVNANTGAIAQRLDYDSFGKVLSHVGEPGFSQPFGFAGGLVDPDTGLVRFGARDYDAEVGRWTARDPILFEGGQSNLYSYVANDPVNSLDVMGLRRMTDACTACATCSAATNLAVVKCFAIKEKRVAAACALIARAGCVFPCGQCALEAIEESPGACGGRPPPPGCRYQGHGPGNPCRVTCPNECIKSPCVPMCGG